MIKIGNEFINENHIIYAKFFPADPADPKDKPEMHVVTTEIELATGYEGASEQASESTTRTFKGDKARMLYDALEVKSYGAV